MAFDHQYTTNFFVGYRFKPTDTELIQCYLFKKEKGELIPCDIIRDWEIYGGEDKEPWKLFGETSSKTFYVFTKLKKKSKQKIDRIAGCGTEDVKDSKWFFKLVQESNESTLDESDAGRRKNGELFEMNVALQLRRSLSELRDVAKISTYSRIEVSSIDGFTSKLF
ncbi:hypothetical protein HRI_003912700 [Hibiscus trionum]|uniref:NAC domain-containing protein n=1 Tax=Hibiscus trionum TaxID=183268 RepID=A0A9W7ITN8_HIBTR|nr:hypothetical protein HRI_003912700 [Hibiscus trionum]